MAITQEQIKTVIDQVNAKEGNVAVFMNTLLNSRFTLSKGKECIFLGGKYATKVAEEIEELLKEIDAGNPHIYIGAELVVSQESLDPMTALKAKIIAEFKESQAAINKGDADFGNYDQSKLNVATSRDVADVASGSISAEGAAPAVGTGIKVNMAK